MTAASPAAPSPRRPVLRFVFAAALAAAFAGFVALGVWQLQRMAWKHDLIARVDARIHAEPETPPARADWAGIDTGDEYRRVRLSGEYLPVPEARTQAVTALGAGWWLLAPLRTGDGTIVLVNRGFVPGSDEAAPPPEGAVEVVGLLRLSEPGGGFLRSNDPGQDRWHSRDVAAIAAARGLPAGDVAPFFIDAEFVGAGHAPGAPRWPRAGLTVVQFRDHHLSYALTWFGMALLTAFAGWRLFMLERHRRRDLRQHSRHLSGPSPGDAEDAGRKTGR